MVGNGWVHNFSLFGCVEVKAGKGKEREVKKMRF